MGPARRAVPAAVVLFRLLPGRGPTLQTRWTRSGGDAPVPADALAHDPLATLLLLVGMAIATALYAALLRRRHADERAMEHSLSSIVDNYGRSGIPESFLRR